jgi:hypothetical protein
MEVVDSFFLPKYELWLVSCLILSQLKKNAVNSKLPLSFFPDVFLLVPHIHFSPFYFLALSQSCLEFM